jgi:hypothetical protein
MQPKIRGLSVQLCFGGWTRLPLAAVLAARSRPPRSLARASLRARAFRVQPRVKRKRVPPKGGTLSDPAPPAGLEPAAGCLTGTLPPLIVGSAPFPTVSVRHSPQPDCPRPYHHERAQEFSAIALDCICNQSSLGGRRSTGQPKEDNASGAMMLSEDKFSEVLVVGDENLPGLRCCLRKAVSGRPGDSSEACAAV